MPASRSPYRVPARADPVRPSAHDDVDRFPALVMLGVLACSLARFVIFAFGCERVGADPLLALAASAASAYCLARHLER